MAMTGRRIMKKILILGASCIAVMTFAASAGSVPIENFEEELVLYPPELTGWEAKGDQFSTATIAKGPEAKNGSGGGTLAFEVKPGAWALVQKKIEGAEWLKLSPNAISFWLKGSGVGSMEVELEESYTFNWRVTVSLTDREWHLVTIPLTDFKCPQKEGISVPDLVVLKFICRSGSPKISLDDIAVECANDPVAKAP
jgi:hypothetical protein